MKKGFKTFGIIGTTAILLSGVFMVNDIQAGTIGINMNDTNISDTEQQDMQTSKVQIYNIGNKHEHDILLDTLENRNGQIIIEVVQGTVLNENGDGVDVCGYCIHYDTDRFSKGDKVQSVFIYDPDNNYIDGILYRVDALME